MSFQSWTSPEREYSDPTVGNIPYCSKEQALNLNLNEKSSFSMFVDNDPEGFDVALPSLSELVEKSGFSVEDPEIDAMLLARQTVYDFDRRQFSWSNDVNLYDNQVYTFTENVQLRKELDKTRAELKIMENLYSELLWSHTSLRFDHLHLLRFKPIVEKLSVEEQVLLSLKFSVERNLIDVAYMRKGVASFESRPVFDPLGGKAFLVQDEKPLSYRVFKQSVKPAVGLPGASLIKVEFSDFSVFYEVDWNSKKYLFQVASWYKLFLLIAGVLASFVLLYTKYRDYTRSRPINVFLADVAGGWNIYIAGVVYYTYLYTKLNGVLEYFVTPFVDWIYGTHSYIGRYVNGYIGNPPPAEIESDEDSDDDEYLPQNPGVLSRFNARIDNHRERIRNAIAPFEEPVVDLTPVGNFLSELRYKAFLRRRELAVVAEENSSAGEEEKEDFVPEFGNGASLGGIRLFAALCCCIYFAQKVIVVLNADHYLGDRLPRERLGRMRNFLFLLYDSLISVFSRGVFEVFCATVTYVAYIVGSLYLLIGEATALTGAIHFVIDGFLRWNPTGRVARDVFEVVILCHMVVVMFIRGWIVGDFVVRNLFPASFDFYDAWNEMLFMLGNLCSDKDQEAVEAIEMYNSWFTVDEVAQLRQEFSDRQDILESLLDADVDPGFLYSILVPDEDENDDDGDAEWFPLVGPGQTGGSQSRYLWPVMSYDILLSEKVIESFLFMQALLSFFFVALMILAFTFLVGLQQIRGQFLKEIQASWQFLVRDSVLGLAFFFSYLLSCVYLPFWFVPMIWLVILGFKGIELIPAGKTLKSRDKAKSDLDWGSVKIEVVHFDEENARRVLASRRKNIFHVRGFTRFDFGGRTFTYPHPLLGLSDDKIVEILRDKIHTRKDFELWVSERIWDDSFLRFYYASRSQIVTDVVAVFLSPVLEEVFKYVCMGFWTPLYVLFPLLELIDRNRGAFAVATLLPFLVHLLLGFVPELWLRIVLHATYNFFAVYFSAWRASSIDKILSSPELKMTSGLIALGVHLYRGSYLALANELVALGWAGPFLDLCKGHLPGVEVTDLVTFLSTFFPIHEHTASGEAVYMRLMSIFPKHISASPTTKNLYPFLVLVIGSLLTRDSRVFDRFVSCLKIPNVVDIIDENSVQDAVFWVWKGIYAVYLSGDYHDFFALPESVRLRQMAVEALSFTGDSIEELDLSHEKIGKLIEEIMYSSDPFVLHYVDKLRDRQSWLNDRKTRVVPRRVPLVLFLFGNPGTGKTQITRKIIDAVAAIRGKKFDPSRVVDIDFNVKYPAEGKDADAEVLVINELQADSTQDTKNGKIDSMIYLQRILDTAPLMFQGASIPDKNKQFNSVELIIITTNEKDYVSSVNVEKLQRRFDSDVVILRQELVIDGQVVIYSHEKHVNISYVDHIRFQPLKAICAGNRISFKYPEKQQWLECAEMVNYLRDRVLTQQLKCQKRENYFSDVCACGLLPADHFLSNGTFLPLLPDVCVPKTPSDPPRFALCSCGVAEEFHHPDAYKGMEHRALPYPFKGEGESLLPVITSTGMHSFARDPGEPKNSSNVMSLDFYFLFSCFLGLLDFLWKLIILGCVGAIAFSIGYVAKECDVEIIKKIGIAITNFLQDQKVFSKSLNDADTETRRIIGELRDAFNDAKAKFEKIMPVIGILLGVYYIVHYTGRPRAEATAKVLTRENVNPNSLVMDSIVLESNYPPEYLKNWRMDPGKFPMAILKTDNVSADQLDKAVKKNVFRVEVINHKGEVSIGFTTFISADFCLMNKHYFFNLPVKLRFFSTNGVEVGNCCVDSSIIQDVEHEGQFLDLVLVRPHCELALKSLYPYLVEDFGDARNADGAILFVDDHYSGVEIARHPLTITSRDGKHSAVESFRWAKRGVNAQEGDCGKPLIFKYNNTCALAGIVNSRWTEWKMGAQIMVQGGPLFTRADIDRAVAAFNMPVVVDRQFTSLEIGELNPISMFRRISSNHFKPFGTIPGSAASFRSALKYTGVKDAIEGAGKFVGGKLFGIPRKVYGNVDGVFKSAFSNAFSNLPEDETYIPALCERVADEYVDHIVRAVLTKHPQMRLSPLTLEEVFFGKTEYGIDRCNFNSSMGSIKFQGLRTRGDLFSWKGSMYDLSEDFLKEYSFFHNLALKGIIRVPLVRASYKDEVRPIEKLGNMDVRIFYLMDLFWNTFARQYAGPIRNFLLDVPKESYLAGKMNASSAEWHSFAQFLHLGEEDWRLIDMDFSKYDLSHRVWMYYVARVFYKLGGVFYQHSDASDAAYYSIRSLCLMEFVHMNDVALLSAILPSGHDCTLIINGIINVLLMLYAFHCLYPEKSVDEFWEKVKSGIQGDDNISAVHASLDKFNMINIAQIYSKLGYRVTPAKKEVEIKPYIDSSEAIFLKRSFRFDVEIGHYLAAIDVNSIWKMLCFWESKGKKGISYSERMSQAYDVAQREFFLHGREVFQREQVFLKELAELENIVVDWRAYEYFLELYRTDALPMSWI